MRIDDYLGYDLHESKYGQDTWFFTDHRVGDVVGMVSVIKPSAHRCGVPELCDIEVRDLYRGRGYSSVMIMKLAQHYGQRIIHTGGYTPMGYERIAKYFHPAESLALIEPEFSDMTFVTDWSQKKVKMV